MAADRVVTRKLDKISRLAIPADERRSLGWDEEQLVEVYIDTARGVLEVRKAGNPSCAFCGTTQALIKVANKYICPECLAAANNAREGN